jgi:ribosome modulation factor
MSATCPSCGGELQLHEDEIISEPVVQGFQLRGQEPERKERRGSFLSCSSCEHCEEVTPAEAKKITAAADAEVVVAYRKLCEAQAIAADPVLFREAPGRVRAARRGAQTRASKAFARACYRAGFTGNAQEICDWLTAEEAKR